MILVKKVDTTAIPIISTLAQSIWPVTYKNIISDDQIAYMLLMMYSHSSLYDQIINKKHQFIIAYDNDIPVGYSSYSIKNETEKNIYRLHKLYVQTDQQGKGIGKLLLNYIIEDIKCLGITQLELNVNRLNTSVHFYKKNGFKVLEEQKLDIGNGFVMDDYIMQKILIR